MIEDFIYSFLLLLGEEGKIHDLSVKDKVLNDLINSEEDFNHIKLKYEKYEWLFPLNNHISSINIKTVEIVTYL